MQARAPLPEPTEGHRSFDGHWRRLSNFVQMSNEPPFHDHTDVPCPLPGESPKRRDTRRGRIAVTSADKCNCIKLAGTGRVVNINADA
jgi:hypothetical protein